MANNCTHVFHKLLHQMFNTPQKTDTLRSLHSHLVHGRSDAQQTSSLNNTLDINYDYKGALLFVVGLLCMYGLCILLLIISLIRKSRTELELVDHLRDFEAMRRASQKKGLRLYNQSTIDDADDETKDVPRIVPVLGYKSIRPDPENDDEHSDIMSVSRAKRKVRRDSFTDSKMSSQDTISSFDDNLSEISFSSVQKEQQVLCMYCARKLTSPGECHHCELEKSLAKLKPVETNFNQTYTSITKPHGLFQTGRYSPEREKYWVEKDLKTKDQPNSNRPKYPKLARYHSVDSTHHRLLENEQQGDESEYIPNSSQRRRSLGNMRLTKQFSMDCPSDDESGLNIEKEFTSEVSVSDKVLNTSSDSNQGNKKDRGSTNVHVSKPKRLLGSGSTSRTNGTMGLQGNSRWLALKALYVEKGSLCSADVEENIPEEDEEDVLTG